MNLQPLFDQPIVRQARFEPAYEGHGEHVYCVHTATETVVVRLARSASDDPFWEGVRHLFGVDPSQVEAQEILNPRLDRASSLRVPRVLSKGTLDGRAWLAVEHLPGRRVEHFSTLTDDALEAFGADLARIHSSERFDEYGSPAGDFRRPLREFHAHVAETIGSLTERFHPEDAALGALARDVQAAALNLPAPEYASCVHVDIDPTQYLTDGERITGLTDTEAHVIGPRELDFIALEYVLGPREASAFARGYDSVLPLPELSAIRPVYRLLYFLFEIQEPDDIDLWMAWPQVFTGR